MLYNLWKSIFFNNEVKPVTENPATENPVQENHQQLNTKLLSTKELNTHISISNAESEFEELWKMYPKKSGKAIALKKYIQYRSKDDGLFNKVKYGITEYSKDYFKNHNRNDLQYMKDGSTFFNQKIWEDYEVYDDVLNATKEIIKDQISRGVWEEFNYDNYGF